MATKNKNSNSAVSRYKIRDKYPAKTFSNSDKQHVATQISRQLNPAKTKN